MYPPETQASDPLDAEPEPAPSFQNVLEPLRHHARVQPDKPALLASGFTCSYGELERRSDAIAAKLTELGVGPGDRIAFVLPRGPETVIVLLGILKTGAAYVPLDSESPVSRIRDCLEDALPKVVIAEDVKVLPEAIEGVVLRSARSLLEPGQEVEGFRPAAIDPGSLAYIIFTSGSTGRPKGVPVTHASLWNFVKGDQEVCIRVQESDRVFHGFSPASDGHHEELWPTFLAGATLVAATSKEIYSGAELGQFLEKHEVTIVSCAPTLLSIVEHDVPSIRRILFGAENCPIGTVRRWWRPNREILNTYGPTEATVGATFSRLHPDRPVTIGQPLPNYHCYVLDDQLGLVADGDEGELGIAGIGVAEGYFRRDDLTNERFVPNPHRSPGMDNDTIYRTGDRVKRDENGDLVWLGRIDSQVKIRGHRIEISEIEAVIVGHPAIQSAVVVTRDDGSDGLCLVALLVLREGTQFEIATLLETMRDTLPGYMVPQSFEEIERIPILPSGKIDRRACQGLHGQAIRIEREIVPPQSELERLVHQYWAATFPHHDVSTVDDFFRDLGGYSLIASKFISQLRNETPFKRVSVLDLYENPTVRSFAALLESQIHSERPVREFKAVDPKRYARAKFWQALGVLVIFGVQGLFWLGPILAAIYFSTEMGHSDLMALVLGIALHAASVPVMFLLAIVVKWTVVGRFKPGSHPLWGGTYVRWWFVQRMLDIAPVTFITGTPLASVYLRLLGAKVGKNVTLESLEIDCPDLVEIGDDCVFENSSWLHPAEVSFGELHFAKIRVGNGCNIGVRAGMAGGSTMLQGSSLHDLTSISSGDVVPPGEEWEGSRGVKSPTKTLPPYDPNKQPSAARLGYFGAVQTVLVLLLTLIDSLPFVAVAFTLYNWSEGPREYALEPLYAVALVLLSAGLVLAVKWGVLGKLKPGVYPQPGGVWMRKWFSDKHLELASSALVPIYDSLFARPWCIALGMKCGPRCEIALPRRMPYDLVSMGEESFLASEVSIGRPVRRNGELVLEDTAVGNRSFLGNDSIVPQGSHVPDEFLLGVLSVCPDDQTSGNKPDQAWLGSPPFQLPARQVVDQFDAARTYRPTAKLYAQRLLHETVRVFLPGLCSLVVASILIEGFVEIWDKTSLMGALACVPLLYLLGTLVGALICRVSKAVLIGRYRPTIQPLWSQFVWKTETHSSVLHDFGTPLFISDLMGTPFLSGFMRFMGAKVGKRAFINTTDWTETDLIQLGDDVAINSNAPLQAHLFEDRVMKVGPIKIGDRCTVGNYSVILCESELKPDAHVGHLSLVMKGETIPSHSFWSGSPARAGEEAP